MDAPATKQTPRALPLKPAQPPLNMPESTSFASFVKDSREKKRNEALAQHFLGGNRGRKPGSSGTGSVGNKRNESEKSTLLNRISGAGIQKRSSSAKPASSIDGKWQHDLHKLNNPNGQAGKALHSPISASQVDRNSRTYEKFASVLNRNAIAQNDVPGFNIKGVANGGPHTVIASNFAPGTTAADIEAVMSPHGGETLGCRLISASPTVMVELQFAEKAGAENVIATFNNQKADGRLLYVYMKDTLASAQPQAAPTRLAQSIDDMDMDTNNSGRGSYQDGRFGFGESDRRDPPRGPRRRF